MSHGDNKNFKQKIAQLPKILLDYKKDPELFNTTARDTAKAISAGTKPTQIRNFYDYILKLNDRAKTEDFNEVLPFVKMLNSKVAYSKTRGYASNEFVEMIKICVNQVKTKNDLNVFKLFFEAVLGFSKK